MTRGAADAVGLFISDTIVSRPHRLKRRCSARLRRHTALRRNTLHRHRAVTASLFGREVVLRRGRRRRCPAGKQSVAFLTATSSLSL